VDHKKKFNQLLGMEIKKLRQAQGLSQEELGYKAGINRTYIGAIERGEKSISVYKLFQILNALQIKPEEFFKNI